MKNRCLFLLFVIYAKCAADEFQLSFQLSVITRIVEYKFQIGHRRHYLT